MIETIVTIQSAFNLAFPSAFANGLELTRGKDAEALPIAIIAINSIREEADSPAAKGVAGLIRTYLERMRLTITVRSADGDFCLNALETLKATFNKNKPLQGVVNGVNIAMHREPGDDGRLYEDDERVAVGELDFTSITQLQMGS